MPSLTLKEIPAELMERLRCAARRQRRSITQQALVLIEGGLSGEPRTDPPLPPAVADQLAIWRSIAAQWESSLTPEQEARSILDARTEGRPVDL